MSRSKNRDSSASVSLFPFLAVLLCTMGGLVVLLVAMSHVSRQIAVRQKAEAAQQAVEQAPPDDQAIERLAKAEQRLTKLQEVQRQAKERLHEEQLRIAQVEAHIRKLQEEMALLMATDDELAADESDHYDDRAQAERELARLHQLIEDTEGEIAQQKAELRGRQKSYSVVPYQGNSGTRRKPIYIECLAERVILQPEGVVLTPDDFRRPLGVGNPLAAALRAAREHLVRDNPNAGFDPDAEPYPLILVRPDGIGAYYKVRDAIGSWEADFGYEMVDSDWNLEFPSPDAQLATVESQAVANARIRREVLAQAAPSAFNSGERTFAIEADGEGLDEHNPYDPGILGDGVGAGTAGDDRQFALQGGRPSLEGSLQGGQQRTEAGAGGHGGSGGEGERRFHESHSSDGIAGSALSGPAWTGPTSTGPAVTNVAPQNPHGQDGTEQDGTGQDGTGQDGTGQDGTGQDGAAQPFSQFAQGELAQGGQPNGSSQASPRQGASGASQGGGSQGASSAGGGASVSMSQGAGKNGAVGSLNKRNRPDDVAIRRGVSVAVFADRLLVGKQAVLVPMPGATNQHAEQFVAAVRRQIESWGLAGHGLYWRPVIKLDVRQGGAERAREIERLLTRSGVDIEPVQTAGLPEQEAAGATR